MFLDKLMNKIPFFRKRRINKIRKELDAIEKDFADGFFNDKYIISLHNILNTGLIKFSDTFVGDSLNKISTYSKTSQSALKLIEKGVYKKSVIERSPLISMVKETVYFTDWYSNEDSVTELLQVLLRASMINIAQNSELGIDSHLAVSDYVSEKDNVFIESLLYRLLLEDLVTITKFYLESQHE